VNPYFVARGPERSGIDGHAGQPGVRASVAGLGQEAEARVAAECFFVPLANPPPARNSLCKRRELAATDRRQQIAHPVVESDFGMLVVWRRVTGLRGKMPCTLDERPVARDEHASAAGRNDLVSVERERGTVAERAGLPRSA
jgi:hypothetical protein